MEEEKRKALEELQEALPLKSQIGKNLNDILEISRKIDNNNNNSNNLMQSGAIVDTNSNMDNIENNNNT